MTDFKNYDTIITALRSENMVSTRKKVYIICCFGEYEYVQNHLQELIDVKNEELIIPYYFMNYEQINQALLTIDELSQKLNISFNEVKSTFLNQFLHKKNNHFQTHVNDAKEIVILLPEHTECHQEDIKEKNQEIEFCGTLKNKRIRTINLLGKQKVIKL